MKTRKPKVSYSYQQICDILCEACKLKIPMNTHVYEDKSYRYYHMVNEKDITCEAAEWRKLATPVDGETIRVIVKKEIRVS